MAKKIHSSASTVIPKGYAATLSGVKKEIHLAQIKAHTAANKELLKLYWSIGKVIYEKEKEEAWASKIIDTFAQDLQHEFPGIKGFSRANIFRMRAFYRAYAIVSEPPRQLEELPIFNIPWWHNVIILTKIKDTQEQLWYAKKALEHGWSSSVLEMHITSKRYKREGKAITNFNATLPSPQSDMAQQSLKDPYIFDFLTLEDLHLEKDIERRLIDHIQKFLLELGEGFAFISRQKHFEIGNDDFYIDLLFYHVNLRCYVVIELKATAFKPEYIGQLNFYLSAVDDILRHPDDKPTIGLLLCKTKNNITAEYALRDVNKPIGVAQYETQILSKLPKNLKSKLPSVEEIEAALSPAIGLSSTYKPKKTRTKKTNMSVKKTYKKKQ